MHRVTSGDSRNARTRSLSISSPSRQQGAADDVLAEVILADEGLDGPRGVVAHAQALEELQGGRVDADGDREEVVDLRGAVGALYLRPVSVPGYLVDAVAQEVRAPAQSQRLQMLVEALPPAHLEVARARAPMHRGDPLLLQRRLDPHRDVVRQVDALGRQVLHERLGDDAPAHVAAAGPRLGEIPRLVDVDGQVQADPVGKLQQEVREQRARRAAADDPDP
jgi:hypothetical protein